MDECSSVWKNAYIKFTASTQAHVTSGLTPLWPGLRVWTIEGNGKWFTTQIDPSRQVVTEAGCPKPDILKNAQTFSEQEDDNQTLRKSSHSTNNYAVGSVALLADLYQTVSCRFRGP